VSGSPDDWRPSASWEVLEIRAAMLASLRAEFCARGFLEVETPLLSADVCVDEHLEPFVVEGLGELGGGHELFLQTSPEFSMKRLVADSSRPIFQVTRAFRRDEAGTRHNPEFTMIEWYEPGSSYLEQMDLVERLVREAGQAAGESPAWVDQLEHGQRFGRLSYEEAFVRAIGVEVLGRPTSELMGLAIRELESVPEGLDESDRDAWLNLLLCERVEPTLGRDRPEFLYDYPASQAALARIRRGDVDVAERMELFIGGLEICNGYQELTDAGELSRRMTEQSRRRAGTGGRSLPVSSRLESALRSGFPECAGVALGFDRLVMCTLGLSRIEQVLAFPFGRA
jgi:lysyl-tRNA synthetase class 2